MLKLVFSAILLFPLARSHSAFFHPSMYGFNVTDTTFSFDNRPVSPLRNRTFSSWWFHGHLDYPPNPTDFFELPAGQTATAEIACDKGATSYHASAGADIRDPNNPNDVCPGRGIEAFHTTGESDLTGCALAIAYQSDAGSVKPEDFTVFSVNQTCVWTRFTDFQVPARMPPCPPDGCTCAFFWVHSQNSGAEENYMNGFKCKVTGSNSDAATLAAPQIPRRCGADPLNNKQHDVPGNCTYGAKQPFYWFNQDVNNMFEGAFSPPVYNDLYNFLDGAQEDVFEDSYDTIPDPSPVALIPTLSDITLSLGFNTSASNREVTARSEPRSMGKRRSALMKPDSQIDNKSLHNHRRWTPAMAMRSRRSRSAKRGDA